MLNRIRFAIVAVVTAVAVPAYGQEVELAWKFPKGAKFYQTMKTTTNQSMKLMGQDVKQVQTEAFVFRWNVNDSSTKAVVTDQKPASAEMHRGTRAN